MRTLSRDARPPVTRKNLNQELERRTLMCEFFRQESVACTNAIHAPVGHFPAAECEYTVKVFNNFVEIHVEMTARLLGKPYQHDTKSCLHNSSAVNHQTGCAAFSWRRFADFLQT
jgi:hypothetical protein